MPVPDVRNNLQVIAVTAFHPTAGTPGGSRISIPAPVRGRIVEVGFMPASLVASAITMAVATGNQTSSTASTFAQIVTSTLGTFSSTNLFEGATASVIPATNAYVNAGDPIQFTCSGGDTSAIGATVYAIIRRG